MNCRACFLKALQRGQKKVNWMLYRANAALSPVQSVVVHFCNGNSLKGRKNHLCLWVLNFIITFGSCCINLNEEGTSPCHCSLWSNSDVMVQQERGELADEVIRYHLCLWTTACFFYLLICLWVFCFAVCFYGHVDNFLSN